MEEAKNRRQPPELNVTDGNNSDANKYYNDEHNRDDIGGGDDDDSRKHSHCYIIAGGLTVLCYRFVACC